MIEETELSFNSNNHSNNNNKSNIIIKGQLSNGYLYEFNLNSKKYPFIGKIVSSFSCMKSVV